MPSFPPDTILLGMWPVVAFVAMECLVATWAATSRRPWHWRAFADWAAVALLWPIEAYDAVWFFAATSFLITVALQPGRRRRRDAHESTQADSAPQEPRACRFHLRDLFLLMLLAGLWLMLLGHASREYQPEDFLGFLALVVCSVGTAAIAVLSYLSVGGHRRWIWRVLLLITIASTVAAVVATGAHAEMPGVPELFWSLTDLSMVLTALTLIAGGLAAFMILAIVLARLASAASHSSRRIIYQSIWIGVLLLAFSPSAYVYLRLLVRAPTPPKFEASPNHYRRIVEIAEHVRLLNSNNVSLAELKGAAPQADVVELESLYAELLPLLDAPNAVDYDPERDANKQYDDRVAPWQSVRALARCLAAESESARARGENDVAPDYGVATVRLGTVFRRGGLLIDYLCGVAFEGIGLDQLRKTRHSLSPADAQRVIDSLERTLAAHEDFTTICTRDIHYSHEVYGWRTRLEEALDSLLLTDAGILKAAEVAGKRCDVMSSLLQANLAVRIYRQENGRWPANLSDLTPEYLDAIPIDPFSNQSLIYRSSDSGFVLYSAGFDGHDDGGTFATEANYFAAQAAEQAGFDLSLDFLPAEQ